MTTSISKTPVSLVLNNLSNFFGPFLTSMQISPWDPESRELRADCFIRLGDPRKAIQDLAPASKLRTDNRAAYLKLSKLHYQLGEHQESLK